MTMQTDRVVERYVSTGVETSFDFRFPIFKPTDLYVLRIDSDGTTIPLVLGLDFSVTSASVGNRNGGTFSLLAGALAAGTIVLALRTSDTLQTEDLRNRGPMQPTAIEDALDRLEAQIQELRYAVGQTVVEARVLRLLEEDIDSAGGRYDAKQNRIINLLAPVNEGDAVTLGAMQTEILSAAEGGFADRLFRWGPYTGNAIQRAFAIPGAVAVSPMSYLAFVQGVFQNTATYEIDVPGELLTFDVAPPNGELVDIVGIGYAKGNGEIPIYAPFNPAPFNILPDETGYGVNFAGWIPFAGAPMELRAPLYNSDGSLQWVTVAFANH